MSKFLTRVDKFLWRNSLAYRSYKIKKLLSKIDRVIEVQKKLGKMYDEVIKRT